MSAPLLAEFAKYNEHTLLCLVLAIFLLQNHHYVRFHTGRLSDGVRLASTIQCSLPSRDCHALNVSLRSLWRFSESFKQAESIIDDNKLAWILGAVRSHGVPHCCDSLHILPQVYLSDCQVIVVLIIGTHPKCNLQESTNPFRMSICQKGDEGT